MRLPIDECIDDRLRLLFPGHEVETARYANLAGLKNGRLLGAAEEAGRLRDLALLVPAAVSAIALIGRGDAVRIR
jgi:hypothetical protein